MEMNDTDKKTLHKWNIVAALFQGVTGVVIMFITNKEATAPSYTYFPNNLRGNTDLWGPQPKERHKVQLGYFSGVFLLLSCANHAFCSTFGKSLYEYYVARNENPIRWIEYSVSASLMHILIAMLSGIFDIHLIVAIFGLTMTTMLFGLLQERMNYKLQGKVEDKSLLPFFLGCVPHIFGWFIICHYFFYGVSNGDPPGFVWAIIFIELILDSTFAITMYLQQTEYGVFSNYMYGEKVFILLSFTAKQLLAWVNYGGTNSLRSDQ